MKNEFNRYPLEPRPAPSLHEDPPWAVPMAEDDEPDEHDRGLELFLRYLRTIEPHSEATLSRQLIRLGIELPPPDCFTEETVYHKLWEVIGGLARCNAFLSHTDHLSDLELYRYLWEVTLNEGTLERDDKMYAGACHLDLLSDWCDESRWLYHRYYADEAERWEWTEAFPGEPMPDRIALPYDRDRFLPKDED